MELITTLKQLFIPYEGNDYTPKFLKSKILLGFVVTLLAVKIITVGLLFPLPKNIFFADITKMDLLGLLNQSRGSMGLNMLTESPILDQAAALKANDMVQNNYFAHQSPQGVTPWHWFYQAGYQYTYAGENLAVGFFDSVNVYNAWWNSPSHKENLLNPHYSEVGTAVVSGFGSNNSTIVVQLFGSKAVAAAPAKTPAKAAPQPVPKPAPVSVTATTVAEAAPSAPIQTQNQPDTTPRVLAQSDVIISQSHAPASSKNNWYYGFLNTIVYSNERVIQYAYYGILLAVIFCFMLNIFVNVEVQRQAVIFRSLLLIGILCVSIFINKDIIAGLLPQITVI